MRGWRSGPVGFVSFRELRSEELFGVLKSMELANAVRRRTSREVLYITGIHAREREIHDGEPSGIRPSFCWRRSLPRPWRKTAALPFLPQNGGLSPRRLLLLWSARALCVRSCWKRGRSGFIYMVDMHEPLMLLHNLETTLKEPFGSSPPFCRPLRETIKSSRRP